MPAVAHPLSAKAHKSLRSAFVSIFLSLLQLQTRDQFLQRYHKRSNVEIHLSMIKAKFRDHVHSKMDVAMVNEVLCKILCHNICCLIQESYNSASARFFGQKVHLHKKLR